MCLKQKIFKDQIQKEFYTTYKLTEKKNKNENKKATPII